MNKTKKLVLMGLFIALSVVCAFIKIPSPTGTVALDAMPAYAAGVLLGGIPGAVVGFLGHIATSLNAGFPLTLPVHLIIAVVMAITVYLFSFTYEKTNIFFASIVGTIINGAGAPLLLMLLPKSNPQLLLGLIPVLLVASGVNVVMADIISTIVAKAGLGFNDRIKKNEI